VIAVYLLILVMVAGIAVLNFRTLRRQAEILASLREHWKAHDELNERLNDLRFPVRHKDDVG
jgi:hypothetical protein